MDALALLCNLHADGPLTLQRLRRAGCDSLDTLFELEARVVGETMGTDARAAERFLREAGLLAERLQGSVVAETAAPGDVLEEVETVLEPELHAEGELAEDDDDVDDDLDLDDEYGEPLEQGLEANDLEEAFDDDDEELEDDEDPEGLETLGIEEVDAREVARVLDAWRDLDRTVPPAEIGSYELPRPEPPPGADVALAAASLEGLAPELRARLEELGVRTLGALAEAPTLELAARVPLVFTRLRHLQFLARREQERCAPAPAATAPPAIRTDPGRLDTAGPFA